MEEDRLSNAITLMNQLRDMGLNTRVIFYPDGSGCVEGAENFEHKKMEHGSFVAIDDMVGTLAREVQRKEYRRNYSRSILDKLLGKNK